MAKKLRVRAKAERGEEEDADPLIFQIYSFLPEPVQVKNGVISTIDASWKSVCVMLPAIIGLILELFAFSRFLIAKLFL